MNKLRKFCADNIYPYFIFALLALYWIYSTDRIYIQSIELNSDMHDIIMVTGFYSILITGALLNIYYNTKEKFKNWVLNL